MLTQPHQNNFSLAPHWSGAATRQLMPGAEPFFYGAGVSGTLSAVARGMPFLHKPVSDIEDPVTKQNHISYSSSPVPAIASMIEYLGPVRESLPAIRVPTLIAYARHDHVVPAVSAHYI